MARVAELKGHPWGTGRAFIFKCPGCGEHHIFQTHWNDGRPAWSWNENFDKPTVHPSIKVTTPGGIPGAVCHSFITNGRIQFLTDSTHHLAGQTVELPELED